MVEQLGELDKGHFAVGAGHFDDPAAEGLAEGVGGEVLDLDMINGLDLFQVAVHHLAGQDRLVFAEEAVSSNKQQRGKQIIIAFLAVNQYVKSKTLS